MCITCAYRVYNSSTYTHIVKYITSFLKLIHINPHVIHTTYTHFVDKSITNYITFEFAITYIIIYLQI